MKTLRKWIRNLLGFSGREINGFLILLPLMLVIVVAMPMYKMWITSRVDDFSAEARILDSLVAVWENHTREDPVAAPAREFFMFDPNLATEADLRRLGFTVSLSKRIANYRQKGGHFRVKSDLLKIYGVDSTFYRQLRAYINLPERIKRVVPERKRTRTTTPPRAFVRTKFDLNTADTSALKSVYGIGTVLASRIVKFRDRLGGFVTEAQVREVYGLDTAAVRRLLEVAFVAEDFVPLKINVNQADQAQLEGHPYISKGLARAIVTYRFQHGPYASLSDLGKLAQFDAETIARALPYLTTD